MSRSNLTKSTSQKNSWLQSGKTGRILSKIFLIGTLIFFYAPIFYILIFSFNSGKSLSRFKGFSTVWYDKVLNPRLEFMDAIWNTVTVALWATAIATILGTITAIGLSRSGKILCRSVERVNELPVMNPDIVTGISLFLLYHSLSITKGYWTVVLAHVMFCTPFVILSIMPKLRSLDPNLVDAALDLGCTPIQAMYKVIIPQIIPGIITGALIAFTMSFDDFVISYFAKGPGYENISTIVYTRKNLGPAIYSLSSIIILSITFILIAVNVVQVIMEKRKKLPANKDQA